MSNKMMRTAAIVCMWKIAAYLHTDTGAIGHASPEVLLAEKMRHLTAIIGKLFSILHDHSLVQGTRWNETREFALVGSISDAVNQGSTPGTYKIIREYVVERFDDGVRFEVYIACSSLTSGEEHYYMRGFISEADLEIIVQLSMERGMRQKGDVMKKNILHITSWMERD